MPISYIIDLIDKNSRMLKLFMNLFDDISTILLKYQQLS